MAHKFVMIPFAKYKRMQEAPQVHENDGFEADGDMVPSQKMEDLLHCLPANIRKNTEVVLRHLGPKIDWNDRNEIIINGDTINDSNVVDLLKSVQYAYKRFEPVGAKHFLSLLLNENVPRSCFKINTKHSVKQSNDTKTRKIQNQTTRKWINI